MAEDDARFAEVVRRHFDIDLVADADADEVFAHLAGDVSQHFVAVGQRHSEHGSRQDLRHGALQSDRFFFSHALRLVFLAERVPSTSSDRRPVQRVGPYKEADDAGSGS